LLALYYIPNHGSGYTGLINVENDRTAHYETRKERSIQISNSIYPYINYVLILWSLIGTRSTIVFLSFMLFNSVCIIKRKQRLYYACTEMFSAH